MKNNPNGPKLPGDDDSWESLATNLFGIDFSKPTIPDEEEISFDLSPELESQIFKKPENEVIPADEDVQLRGSLEDEEAGFPDEEFDDELEAEFDEEPEPEFSVDIASKLIEEDAFAGFDDEDDEEELDDEELEAEAGEDIEEEDTYWEALNDFEWDADEEEPASRPGKSSRRDSSHRASSRSARGREEKPSRGREEKPAKKGPTAKASVEERAIVDEEISSAADYINEYDDSEFGVGLVEESRPARVVKEKKEKKEEDEDILIQESLEPEMEDDEDEDEPSPERKRRRRRRRRKPRGESSERETPAAPSKAPEDTISLEDMDFESLSEEDEVPPAQVPRARVEREEVDEVDEVDEEEEERPRRKRSRRRRQKPEIQAEAEPVSDSFSADLSDEDEDVEEVRKPRRGKRERARDEDLDAGDEAPRGGRSRKEQEAPQDKESLYRNIPTWEEAISYLIQPKRSGAARSERESSGSDSPRSSGGRRRRRRS